MTTIFVKPGTADLAVPQPGSFVDVELPVLVAERTASDRLVPGGTNEVYAVCFKRTQNRIAVRHVSSSSPCSRAA